MLDEVEAKADFTWVVNAAILTFYHIGGRFLNSTAGPFPLRAQGEVAITDDLIGVALGTHCCLDITYT